MGFNICIAVIPQGRAPGFNERVVCHTPAVSRQQQRDAYQRPLVNPQTGQPLISMLPDLPATFSALQQQGYLNPQLTLQMIQCRVLGYVNENLPLQVLCCQLTPLPTVVRTQENAVFNQPVGNPGAPNDVIPEGTHGGWVTMPNSGLPSSADPVFGAQDGYGGAHQNLDLNQGRQTIQESTDLTGVGRMSDTYESARQRAEAALQNANGEVRSPWR